MFRAFIRIFGLCRKPARNGSCTDKTTIYSRNAPAPFVILFFSLHASYGICLSSWQCLFLCRCQYLLLGLLAVFVFVLLYAYAARAHWSICRYIPAGIYLSDSRQHLSLHSCRHLPLGRSICLFIPVNICPSNFRQYLS